MTVERLIERLSRLPKTTRVLAWDDDAGEYQEVIDVLWDDSGSELLIQTHAD